MNRRLMGMDKGVGSQGERGRGEQWGKGEKTVTEQQYIKKK